MICTCGKEVGVMMYDGKTCWSCGRAAFWLPSRKKFEMRRRRTMKGVIS